MACQSCNGIQLGGGVVAGGSAIVSVNKAWDGYAQVYHLQESGNGTTGEYEDATDLTIGTGGAGKAEYTPERVEGLQCGYAQYFIGDRFIKTTPDSTQPATDLSVSLWIKPTGRFLDRVYYSKGKTAAGEGWCFTIGHDVARQLTASVQVQGLRNWKTYTVTDDEELDLEQWYHVAAVYKRGSYLKLYLNGTEVASRSLTETSLVPSTVGNFIGKVDNVKLNIGIAQELRVKPEALTEDWLTAEKDNVCDAFFYSVGDEELP